MSGDLPHDPSDPDTLHKLTTEVVQDFHVKLRRERHGPGIQYRVLHKTYGAQLRIAFASLEYCHCDDQGCKDGKYFTQETVVRIKKDSDICYLRSFLKGQLKIWERKAPEPDSDEGFPQ
jgi:hypothetical protein